MSTQDIVDQCAQGNLEFIKECGELGTHLLTRLMEIASFHGYLDIVKFVVEKGAYIDRYICLALSKACQRGHLDIVKFLANRTFISAQSCYCIVEAIKGEHLHVLKFIFSGEIHMRTLNFALRQAANKGSLEIVKFLLSIGADINSKESLPLKWAVEAGHLELVRYLIQQGATIPKFIPADFCTFKSTHISIYAYLKAIQPKVIITSNTGDFDLCPFYTFVCSFHNKSIFEKAKNIKQDELFDPNLSLIVASYCW